MLERANRIHSKKCNDSNKLYNMQAPEVECIAKGKAHKKYEFGCKVSLVSTSQDSWIVGVQAVHGNPYDGHTLNDALNQAEAIAGRRPQHAYCDKGYKGAPAVLGNTEVMAKILCSLPDSASCIGLRTPWDNGSQEFNLRFIKDYQQLGNGIAGRQYLQPTMEYLS